MKGKGEVYYDFASKVSFFEFIQEEFRSADIKVDEFKEELSHLMKRKKWNINNLSDYIKKYPRSFIIFEQLFQLLRFTNAQLIHFVFDVAKLNSNNLDAIYEYMILNLKYDPVFREIYLKLLSNNLECKVDYNEFVSNVDKYNKKLLIAIFKSSIAEYIDKISKDFNILENRIKKDVFEDFSIRFSNYLLNNLRLNEMLESINVEAYLRNKRIPIDTKSLHGNYPMIKIKEILKEEGYTNIDDILAKNNIKILKHDLRQQINIDINGNKIFCTEKYVEGIIKPKERGLKKFDLIIFDNFSPKYLFEINFYSTAGTKIGINQNEYIYLNEFIQKNFKDFKFYWITDGNYWLTPEGKRRYLNLLQYFDKILNINTFREFIKNFDK
jgi:hypothetical protein